MDERYWDETADHFDREIFDVLRHDRQGVIRRQIRASSSEEGVACDFGCGTGRALPTLAGCFSHVIGTDISGRCLAVARRRCARLGHVELVKADLSVGGVELPSVDFGLSVNVAIMPSHAQRMAILRTVARHVRRGGRIVLVVPSLESALFAHHRLVEWRVREGQTYARASARGAASLTGPDAFIERGLVALDGGPTKHYLREELLALSRRLRVRVLSVEKVTYPWGTEFESPPAWMKAPYPWDWLVVLERR